MASPIKQESGTEEVKPTISSLNSNANLPIKTEPPSPNNNEIVRANLPMKTEGSDINPSPNANEIIRANRLNLLVKNEGPDANSSSNNNEIIRANRLNLLVKNEGPDANSSSNNNGIIRANRLNLLVKNEGPNANSSSNNNEEYRNGDVKKKKIMKINEENKKNVNMNPRLPPRDLHLKNRSFSNQCSEVLSTSMPISLCMPLNNQESSRLEVDFSDTYEGPSLIVVGCSYCLMYVMVSEIEPRCPRCLTTDVIDIFRSK